MNYNYENTERPEETGGEPPAEGIRETAPSGEQTFAENSYDPRDYQYSADNAEVYGKTGDAPPAGAPDIPEKHTESPAETALWWEHAGAGAERTPDKSPEPMYREPSYREVRQQDAPYTPGITQAPFYVPPNRENSDASVNGRFNGETQRRPARGRVGSGILRTVCLLLICAIVGAASGILGVQYAIEHGDISPGKVEVILGSTPAPSAAAAGTPLVSAAGRLSAEDIYTLACSQVVSVMSQVPQQTFFGVQTGTVYGSGFIISEDGYILTNHHVVSDAISKGSEINVVVYDGSTYKARVVGYEEDNDVAVIKIEASGLSPVRLGSSEDMRVGKTVYAVGNPSRLDYTMTDGIISALDREVQISDSSGFISINMFQISAAVNRGNSGGPVYNEKGEVLGIVSAKYVSEDSEGLGFAIPIDDAMNIASELISNGYVSGKASIGVEVYPVDAFTARYYDMVEGAYVYSVIRGSAADNAGVQKGDIITALGEYPVNGTDALKTAKRNFKAGETTTITVFRDTDYLELDITFDEEMITKAD